MLRGHFFFGVWDEREVVNLKLFLSLTVITTHPSSSPGPQNRASFRHEVMEGGAGKLKGD